MIIGISTYKGVNGFTDRQMALMRAYLQGAVYCWCKNCKDEWFAARDLIGGNNYYWQGTPLIDLFEYYLDGRNDDASIRYAVEEAGKAAGRLLKGILIEDKRTFETREGFTREYHWTGDEDN